MSDIYLKPCKEPSDRDAAERVVRELQQAGHTAYFAGGCVRDMLLGLPASDYDVATSARPEAVLEQFHKAYYVGEAFGVVIVRLLGAEVEVATFRLEWGYEDGRRPTQVEFTDAEHDARRRDFTINGLFYDPITEQVHDYVGGQTDLEARVIRAIGEPEERFAEDYLRMLRAVRFTARLQGFSLDPLTAGAIRKHARDLTRISRERIGIELRGMLASPSRHEAVALLQSLQLDGPVLDEPGTTHSSVLLHRLDIDDFVAALAAWAIDRHLLPLREGQSLGSALSRFALGRLVRRWRAALVLSNEESDGLRDALKLLPDLLHWHEADKAQRKRWLARSDWPRLAALLRAAHAAGLVEDIDIGQFAIEQAALIAEGVAPEPLINGMDLIAAGMPPGPAFKKILDTVYDAQLRGDLTTEASALHLAKQLATESR